MRKISRWMVVLLFCIVMIGCNSEKYCIRKNIPTEPVLTTEHSAPSVMQTESIPTVPEQLQMDGTVIREENLRFEATKEMLCNDLGFYLQRQISEDFWLPDTEAIAPYSREEVRSQRLDLDPLLKNDPLICVYLNSGQLCEANVILLTHDLTMTGQQSFLELGRTLLQCFWPKCEVDVIAQTVTEIHQDIRQNAYPTDSAVSTPQKLYVHETAASYGYTHANHIGIHVIPVDETRIQEWKNAGLEIVEIP